MSGFPETPPISRISSQVRYHSPWMQLRVDAVRLADGAASEYGVVIRQPFVLVLARSGPRLLAVQQYRYPVDRWTLEFPQGALDAGEDPQVAAMRELREETGYVLRQPRVIGSFYEAAGFATQLCTIVMGEAAEQLGSNTEASESGMRARWLTRGELQSLVQTGAMTDGPSLAALSIANMSDPSFASDWTERAPLSPALTNAHDHL